MATLAPCVAAPGLTAQQHDFGHPWTTQPEFEIGEGAAGSGPAAFGLISAVRVLGNGDRILVVEAASARATIWTPEGSLIGEVGGPGEGPGEFAGMFDAQVHRAGFFAIDDRGRRFTSFSNEGTFIETIPFPPRSLTSGGRSVRPTALLDDGSIFASPIALPSDLIGGAGSGPVESLPLLRLSQEDAAWIMDTLVMLDCRNRGLVIRLEGRGGGIQSEQIYGDHDLTWFDPFAGSVIVARRNLGGGHVELLEITAAGDTVWTRHLALPPVSMTPDQVDALVDDMARGLGRDSPTPHEAMRAAVREALYLPDPLPGVRAVRGTASGEVWLTGFEKADTLGASYAVRRNDDPAGVRKVLLPPGFRVMDATDTHVWGIRRDDLGTQYVVGRRLVPPAKVR